MDETYRLSVIIPCFNGEQVIGEALESLVSQPLVKGGQVEILVIDDGSSDGTSVVCQAYANYPFVRCSRIPNGGAANARNVAISMARGEWVSFLDADDLYLTDVLDETFGARLDAYRAQGVEIIRTPWVSAGGGLRVVGDYVIVSARALPAEAHHLYSTSFASCLYRRDFIEDYQIRFLVYTLMDVETSFRYLAFSFARQTVIDNRLMFYVCRDNVDSSTHRSADFVIDRTRARAYYDLACQTPHLEDRGFLFKLSISALWGYWKGVMRDGSNGLEGEMQDLLVKLWAVRLRVGSRLHVLLLTILWPLVYLRGRRPEPSRRLEGEELLPSRDSRETCMRLAELTVRARMANRELINAHGIESPYANRRNPREWGVRT